jgi:hypothetical protein
MAFWPSVCIAHLLHMPGSVAFPPRTLQVPKSKGLSGRAGLKDEEVPPQAGDHNKAQGGREACRSCREHTGSCFLRQIKCTNISKGTPPPTVTGLGCSGLKATLGSKSSFQPLSITQVEMAQRGLPQERALGTQL